MLHRGAGSAFNQKTANLKLETTNFIQICDNIFWIFGLRSPPGKLCNPLPWRKLATAQGLPHVGFHWRTWQEDQVVCRPLVLHGTWVHTSPRGSLPCSNSLESPILMVYIHVLMQLFEFFRNSFLNWLNVAKKFTCYIKYFKLSSKCSKYTVKAFQKWT